MYYKTLCYTQAIGLSCMPSVVDDIVYSHLSTTPTREWTILTLYQT